MSTIGLPRALLYYQYAPILNAFFRTLGVEVIVSSPTTGETLSLGASRVVSETCLPVKIYCGHVLSLVGRADHIFIPSIHCLHPGSRNCPKLVGLPDLISDTIPAAPLLVVDVNFEDRWQTFSQVITLLGRHFTVNPLLLKKAFDQVQMERNAQDKLLLSEADPPGGLPKRAGKQLSAAAPLTLGVVGHPYNIFDDFASQKLTGHLEAMGVRVRTPENIPGAERWSQVVRLAEAPYWTFEDEIVGAAGGFLDQGVDGILAVSSFGCAPDSVMLGIVSRAAREAGAPFMSIILDEHTGEAGLLTRLEAFVDLLLRRKERLL